jgi:hypothetical protein
MTALGRAVLPDVVAVDLDVGLGHRLPGHEVGEGQAAGHRAAADGDGHGHAQAGRVERHLRPRPQLGVDDGQLRRHQLDHGRHHVGGHHRVDGRAHQAGLGAAELGQQAFHRVLAEEHDDVAAAQPAGQQPVRELVGQLVGLPVGQPLVQRVAERPRPADESLLVGKAPGHALKQVADAGPLPAVHGPPVVQAGHIEISVHAALTSLRRHCSVRGGSL